MRTVEEIKKEICQAWMTSEELARAYGFEVGSAWSYSRMSVENVLVWLVASAIWMHERIFVTHTEEVTDYIARMKPHTLRWWVERAKLFQKGSTLPDDSCDYDNANLSDEEVEKRQIVKFASATEQKNIVYLKVAKEEGGAIKPLDDDEKAAFCAYVDEIRAAGVTVMVVSESGCQLKLAIDVYYDPMVMDGKGKRLADGTSPVEDTIKQYIENLPFDGEYRNSELIDRLQAVEGVVMPELRSAEERMTANDEWATIQAFATPYSGYYQYDEENVTINYIIYNN